MDIKESDSPFIKQLLMEINEQSKIHKNAEIFINTRKLKEYNLSKNFSDEQLPTEIHLGTVYLIKNNSIIGFHSSFAYENINIQYSTPPEIFYRCTVTIYNLNQSDVGDFVNADIFIGMDELISHDVEKTKNFIKSLVKTGFKLYLTSS